MFFVEEQSFPAFMMQVSVTYEAACPVVGVSGPIWRDVPVERLPGNSHCHP